MSNNEVIEIAIKTEYIQLQQLLKFVGIVSMGSDVKYFLTTNEVYVDGELENRRGRKIYRGMTILIDNKHYKVI